MDSVQRARHRGLAETIRYQEGLIRRDQAIACGLDPRAIESRVRRQTWRRVLPRVYAVDGEVGGARRRIRAGWLWAGDDSVVASPAAAYWLDLGPAPTVVDLIVAPDRRLSSQPGWIVHRASLDDRDWVWRSDIRVTGPARTVIDLARAGVRDGGEEALRRRLVTPERLDRTLDRGRGSRGQVAARVAVAELRTGPWSVLERDVHRLFRAAGIEGWTANRLVKIAGRHVFLDLAIEPLRLAIEIDGREVHSRPEVFENDRERQNLLVLAGWTVLRFTSRQLRERPDWVISVVRATIARLAAAPGA